MTLYFSEEDAKMIQLYQWSVGAVSQEVAVLNAISVASDTDIEKPIIGRWKKVEGPYMTPEGTPLYVCEKCGCSQHLHGVEYSRRKVFCDQCGTVNFYPWEKLDLKGD